jgi:hypothetical protein
MTLIATRAVTHLEPHPPSPNGEAAVSYGGCGSPLDGAAVLSRDRTAAGVVCYRRCACGCLVVELLGSKLTETGSVEQRRSTMATVRLSAAGDSITRRAATSNGRRRRARAVA